MFDEEQLEMVAKAELAASTLPETIALAVLSSPDGYVKRICWDYDPALRALDENSMAIL